MNLLCLTLIIQLLVSFFEFIASDCTPPQNTAGLMVEYGTLNGNSPVSVKPSYVCECEMGKKFFYQSSTTAIPTKAYNKNTLAYALDGFYHQCNDICICSIEGICYTQTSYYAKVILVPFCEHEQCHVYAAPTVEGLYTSFKTEQNAIYHQPNPDNTSVGINSKYIKVEAISCFGCKNIRNAKCFGQAKQVCTPPENSAGLIVTVGTISARIDKTSLPVATCQTTNSLKYFWNASQYGVPYTAYNKSSAAFIIDSNGYCPDLCIRGEDGKFYEPLNDDFYVEFLSFCDDHGCHMYAAVNEDKGGPIKLKNGPTIHMPNTYNSSVGANTTYLKAVAVSCFTCADIKNEDALGPTVPRKQQLLLPYPTLYYNANGTNFTLIDVLEEDTVGDVPGVAHNVITQFCEMAYGTSAWNKNEGTYVTDLLNRNASTLTDFCVLANIEKYKSLAGNQAFEQLLGVEQTSLGLRRSNFILITVFGIPGLIFCGLVIHLMKIKNSVIFAFGLFCIVQAVNDSVLLANNIFLEGYRNIKFFITDNDSSYIFGYNVDYIMFYINQCSCMICASLGILMSFNRFIALYFPFQYDKIFSKVKTDILCSMVVGAIVVGNLPLLIISDICTSDYHDGYYDGVPGCGATYQFAQVYYDFFAIFICLIFDILTAFKLRQFIKQQKQHQNDKLAKKKANQEKLFLLQNITKFFTFVIFTIPYFLIEYYYVYDINNWFYQIVYLLYMYNCFRTIWRCLDQALTFWIQHRLAKINNMRTSVIQVSTTAMTFNNKRPSIFSLKFSQLSAKIDVVNNLKRK